MELDDFLALASLARGDVHVPPLAVEPVAGVDLLGGANADDQGALDVPAPVGGDGALDALVEDLDGQELHLVAGLAGADLAPVNKHARRSWQHTQVARHGKSLKRARNDQIAERLDRQVAETRLIHTEYAHGVSTKLTRSDLPAEQVVVAKMLVAVDATWRGRKSAGQAVAAIQLARVIEKTQKECLESFLVDRVLRRTPCPSKGPRHRHRVLVKGNLLVIACTPSVSNGTRRPSVSELSYLRSSGKPELTEARCPLRRS